ncbi:MAG: PASTA domain-containing protein [Ilumatobacteraceae bacterium]
MASQQQFSGRTVAGRYRLGSRRGSGLDAAVFDAFDERDQRVVSLTVVHPDICANPVFAGAFDETMRCAAALREPHIAQILDWGTDRWNRHQTRYVTVEQLGGGSLRDVLDRGRTLSPSQTLSVGLDVLRALDVVHRGGLVHGDVRPSTIVFGDDGVPRLIDVGLGQLLGGVLWADAVHVSNDRAMYVAPEVAGEHRLVPKSDVYSLSLTMLECVTGRVPFVGDSTVATLQNRMNKLLPVSADLGPLAAVLERAGRPDPEGRSSVAELGQALVRTAERLPRPAPIQVFGAGLFDLDEAEATRQLGRPVGARSSDETGGSRVGRTVIATGAAAAASGPSTPTPLGDPLAGAHAPASTTGPDVPGVDDEADDADVAAGSTAAGGAASVPVAGSATPDDAPAAPGADAAADAAAASGGAGGAAAVSGDAVAARGADVGDAVAAAISPTTAGADVAAVGTDVATGTGAGASAPTSDSGTGGAEDVAAAPSVAAASGDDAGAPIAATTEAVRTTTEHDDGGPPTQAMPSAWVPAPTGAGTTTPPPPGVDDPTGVAAAFGLPDLASTQAMPAATPPPDPTQLMPTAARVDDRAGIPSPHPPVAPTIYDEDLPGEPRRRRRSRLWWIIPLILVLAAAGGAATWFFTRTVSHTVPDLAGKSQGAALNEVSGFGWSTLTPQEPSETVADGMVISTDPPAGTKLAEGKTLTIVISTGPAPRTLPELRGKTVQEATDTLTGLGLETVVGDAVFDDTIPKDSVVSWTVPDQPNLVAGNSVNKGTTVRIIPSKGPAPRLPDVTGQTLDQATATLAAQQLQISQGAPVNDETVLQGIVVSWSVPDHPELTTGAVVDPGTTVQVVLSAGPAPRTVPSLGGLAAADAKAAVEAIQLADAEGPAEFSDSVPAGAVIRQDPAAGAQVPRDSTVTVVLSKGPDVVAVPEVIGLGLQQAQNALATAGLSVGTVTGNANGTVSSATVDGQAVTTGQQLRRGTAVDLTVT